MYNYRKLYWKVESKMQNEQINNINIKLTMPLIKLLFLLIITFTLYTPFWFYYKWKALNDTKFKNILLALSTGIPFGGIIPQFILFKCILDKFYKENKKISFFISFNLTFILFIALYSIFISLKLYSNILFSICFYVPSLIILQFIISAKVGRAYLPDRKMF